MTVKSAHAMKLEVLNTLRALAKTFGVENLNAKDQGTRHFLRALGRAAAQLGLEAGVVPAGIVGLAIEGVQNALEHKDATVTEALGAAPVGDA